MVDPREVAQDAYWNYIGERRKLDTMTPGTPSYKSWEKDMNNSYNKAIRYGITGQQMREVEIKHKKAFGY